MSNIKNPSLYWQQTPAGREYLKPIREMSPFNRLIYWITERHKIHCKRFDITKGSSVGRPMWFDDLEPSAVERPYLSNELTGYCEETPPPWTNDPILQSVFFCNPYRENDRVTAYLRDNFREEYKSKPCVFLGTILLRSFNHIGTMRRLINAGIPQRLGSSPKESRRALADAGKLLIPLRDKGEQMFGGAYIIKYMNGVKKVEAGLMLMNRFVDQEDLYEDILKHKSMEHAAKRLTAFRGMGPFYVYQFIGDLAYTHVLDEAEDWDTWSFCGPGTSRGSLRLKGINRKKEGGVFERRIAIPQGWYEQLLTQKEQVNDALAGYDAYGNRIRTKPVKRMPHIHMRDMTGCLCEFDKYERALNNERNLKRGYPGTP